MKIFKDKLIENIDSFAKETGNIASNIADKTKDIIVKSSDKTKEFVDKSKNIVDKSKESVTSTFDSNGDGQLDIEDFIILALKAPGVKVYRSEFLNKEFLKRYPKEIIDDAILYNPSHANIPIEEINKIADEVIKFERNCVSGISAALGMPGGFAMIASIPADIIQYYGYMLRATQKLMYLYGFPEIDTNENNQSFDSETMNILIICLGVMYGVQGANAALKGIARAFSVGVEKQLMKTALTKGTIYPIVKNVSKWFGVKMTKQIYAGFFKKSIPLAGGIIGGGITFFSFKPCCDKLKNSLKDTILTNPNYKPSNSEEELILSPDELILESDYTTIESEDIILDDEDL